MTREEAINALKLMNLSAAHPFLHWEEMMEVRDMAISALRAQQELESNSKAVESNDPLTLDELRGMDGEPVYIVENTEYWSIVNGFDQKGAYLLSHGNPDDYGYFGLYGKTWLSYRHKPDEALTNRQQITNRKQLTNADSIRAMSDEELASWMAECNAYRENAEASQWLPWLQQPAAEADHER